MGQRRRAVQSASSKRLGATPQESSTGTRLEKDSAEGLLMIQCHMKFSKKSGGWPACAYEFLSCAVKVGVDQRQREEIYCRESLRGDVAFVLRRTVSSNAGIIEETAYNGDECSYKHAHR